LTAASPEALNAALDVLRQNNCLLATLSPKKSTLEEIFIALMSEKQEYLAPAK